MSEANELMTCPTCKAPAMKLTEAEAAGKTLDYNNAIFWIGPADIDDRGDTIPRPGTGHKVSLTQRLRRPHNPSERSAPRDRDLGRCCLYTMAWTLTAAGVFAIGFGILKHSLITVILGIALLLFWGLSGLISTYQSEKQYLDRSSSPDSKEQMRRWERAIAVWNALYFCPECKSLFFPGSNEIIPSMFSTSMDYLSQCASQIGFPEDEKKELFTAYRLR